MYLPVGLYLKQTVDTVPRLPKAFLKSDTPGCETRMKKVALFLIVLIVFGLGVSVVSAGGYADPKSFEEWRPSSLADADKGNVVGMFNRAFVHLTGLYQSASGFVPTTFNYQPMTNRASPVYVAEEWTYGGYPYFTDEELGPISNRCG
jgi:hypothetical protein